MNGTLILTLFDETCPCWTKEMLLKEGVSAQELAKLCEDGYLDAADGVYSLTSAGVEGYKREAAENFIEEGPGLAPADRARSARAGAAMKLFDAAHTQRWGMKHYFARPRLTSFPAVTRDSGFKAYGEKLTWPYMDGAAEKQMEAEFPPRGVRGRPESLAADAERAEKWLEAHRSELDVFEPDILYLSRYDYLQYTNFKGHPMDQMNIINTDRFALVLDDGDIEKELQTICGFRRWIMLQRRVVLPGFFDIDTQEQDSVTWLLLVTDTEDEAINCADRLARFGEQIMAGAEPFEVWTMSMERLAEIDEKREVVWELLPDAAHPVCRSVANIGR